MNIHRGTEKDSQLISKVIRNAYQTVAEKFGLTMDNCPTHPSNCTDKWIDHDFAKGVKYYILESTEGVIGCAALEKADPELCYLERLAVIPEKRNRGLGKTLVDHVFREAKSMGCKRISIGIIAKQTELKKWYQTIGFIEGETKEFEHLPFQVLFMEYTIR